MWLLDLLQKMLLDYDINIIFSKSLNLTKAVLLYVLFCFWFMHCKRIPFRLYRKLIELSQLHWVICVIDQYVRDINSKKSEGLVVKQKWKEL